MRDAQANNNPDKSDATKNYQRKRVHELVSDAALRLS